jgi:ubiquinone/menaquinone biosynthesis C-methylase UbiE
MDYDKTEIATRYDKARALEPGTLRLWKNTLAAHVDQTLISLVIDLGSGTGRFSELLATHFGSEQIKLNCSMVPVTKSIVPAQERVRASAGAQ